MEQTDILKEYNEVQVEYASTGQRFVNYLVDAIAFYMLIFLIAGAFGAAGSLVDEDANIGLFYLITFAVIFAYYTLLEGSKGKTLGKLLTKTKVVGEDGQPISYGKAFIRTLCRLVPFEFISVFINKDGMWHDKWTNTRVVKDK